MKINQIVESSAGGTCAGAIASISKLMGETQKRILPYGSTKVATTKKAKKGPYSNSLSEGKMNELSLDLTSGKDGLTDEEFKKKYGKTKQEMRKELKPTKPTKPTKPVQEADLHEEDKIISPDKASKLKTGFHGKDEKPKLSGFKAPFKASGLWVSDSRGKNVLECVTREVAPEVAKALNVYIKLNKPKLDDVSPGGVIAGGGVGEESVGKSVSKKD